MGDELAARATNWERLGMVGRQVVIMGAAVLVGPAAAGVWRGAKVDWPFDGATASWLGLLAGPVLMAMAAAIFASRRASWGVWLAAGVGVLHLGVFVAGWLLAALFSGMIAPCGGSTHFEPWTVTAWVLAATVPLGVVMSLAMESWVVGPAMLAGAFAAGRWCESGGAMGPAWGVLAWDAGVFLPLAGWLAWRAKR